MCVFLLIGAFNLVEELEPLCSLFHQPVDVSGMSIAGIPCCWVSVAVCFPGSNWSKSYFGAEGRDQLVLLKCFGFLVNTPTVSHVLFLGNISSAFMKQVRCLGPLVSKGKAI